MPRGRAFSLERRTFMRGGYMIILQGNDIELNRSDRVEFKNVSFAVDENDKIGLAGVNGAGKTTFFRLLSGSDPEDWSGRIDKPKDVKIGFMEQHVLRSGDVTVYGEAISVFQPLIDMEAELDSLHRRIDDGEQDPELLERQMRLSEQFQRDGGLTFRARTKSMLAGMGFGEEQQQKQVSVLSGGERSKLQLVKLLLSGANLLLLDEPTNHLDIEACEWLEKFLLDFRGAYIVISHDRYFLDKVTNKTFALDNGTLTTYKGNYTEYLRQYDERVAFLAKKYAEMTEEIARIEGIIEQQKRFNQAHNYVTIASKQKQIDRIKAELVPPPPPRKHMKFSFPCTLAHGTDAITVQNLAFSVENRALFRNVSFDIKYGERVFLMGANGCGKSSLVKILMGVNKQDSGKYFIADWLKTGYFDQLQDLRLTSRKTVLDFVWDEYPRMSRTEVQSALAMFQITGEEVAKQVNTLSGGEAAKVVLLKIMLSGPNLLIFDEPTNHLDLEAREALTEALESYKGTMLIISHDRSLINRIATKIMFLREDGVEVFEGNYDKYKAQRDGQPQPLQDKQEKAPKQNDYKLQKELQSRLRKAKTRMERAEAALDGITAETEELNRKMSAGEMDYTGLMEATERLAELEKEQARLLAEWEAAEAEAAELEKE